MENIAGIDCVFFDMDGTLTDTKSPWQRVFEHLNIWQDKGEGYLYGWLKGKYDYNEFCRMDIASWEDEGLTEDAFSEILSGISIHEEAVMVLRELAFRGIKCIIISTGFYRTAQAIAEKCSISFEKGLKSLSADVLSVFANNIVFKGRRIKAEIDVNADSASLKSKGKILKKCLKKLKISPESCLSAGDSLDSDKELFNLTGDYVFVEHPSNLMKLLLKAGLAT